MKKIIVFLITSMFFFGQASAVDFSVSVGLSGSTAVFHAEGEENENGEKSKEDATGVAGFGSVFAEASINDMISIGVDFVTDSISSETAESVVDDKTTTDTSSRTTQKVQVDFNDLTTYYVMVNLTEGLYVRGGVINVDVITNESLGTGSTYGDTTMDGTVMGVGYNRTLDNGVFFRVEGNYMDLGNKSLTASNGDNKVSLNDLIGASAKISVGKSF